MALVLGASVGDIIDIGQHHIQVMSIGPDRRVTLWCGDGRQFVISEAGPTTIFANVAVKLGPAPKRSSCRLVFDAPKTVPIFRRR